MKTIVLFESSTGSTEKYAKDIANKIGGDVSPLKKFKWKNLKNYDCVIFGGWVLNGKIQGLDNFLAHYDEMNDAKKNILVFSSGLSFPSPEGRKDLINRNILDLYHVRYYQLRGSFDINKLNWKYKLAMKLMVKKITGDPNSSPEQVSMYSSFLTTPIEYYDYEKVDKIVAVVNKLSLEPIDVEVK